MKKPYVELHCPSNFTVLDGAAHPEDLVARAKELGYEALALTDRDGLYGAIRFAKAARETGLKAILGSEVTLADGHHLTLLARTAEGYANLAATITAGRLAAPKGESRVALDALAARARGLVALSGCPRHGEVPRALRRRDVRAAREAAGRLRDIFGRDAFFLELQDHRLASESQLCRRLRSLGRRLGVPLVSTNDVRDVRPDDRDLQDVLACIRHGTTLARAGRHLLPNAEFFLRPPAEVGTIFSGAPEAVASTLAIAESCEDGILDRLGYRFPSFPVPPGEPTVQSYLRRLTFEGARGRYGIEPAAPLPAAVVRQVEHELAVIEKLGLAGYFLVVWDIARFCRERGILAQGRGSAANSAVCYCLGITAVDPVRLDLLFERFLSEDRQEAPDIDLDIANADREEVIQYVYDRYGRDRAGMVCEVITYRGRSALRDVGKVIGLSLEQVDRLAKAFDGWDGEDAGDTIEARRVGAAALDSEGPVARRLADLCRRIEGFPRHLSIHVGGMVVTAGPLAEVVPIENAAMPGRTVIQWDKDDCGEVGIIKIDLLGLGMLTLLSLALRHVEERRGIRIDLARLDHGDPRVYDTLCAAETIGVFQVESRAQMSCLPRLKPRTFYDLVVEIALIRPGPIQGDMVHPYLRRRAGEEPITYPHPSLRPILERTLGVPLFQEQGLRVAMAAAGFTAGEADELRRAMGHKRSRERKQAISRRLVEGMARNGIEEAAAERIYKQLAAFADYGFPESHAASFALLVYASAFLKLYYPSEFTCALLNAQPMGFYAPATIVHDARRHAVEVRSVDAARSAFDCTLETSSGSAGGHAVRIGLRYVRGVGEAAKERLDRERERAPFRSVEDFVRRSGLGVPGLRSLALAGGFGCFGFGSRREALWRVLALLGEGTRALKEPSLAPVADEPEDAAAAAIPPMSRIEEAAADFLSLGLSTRYTALDLVATARKAGRGFQTAAEVRWLRDGDRVRLLGGVICRQRPGTARGLVFMSLEDETGIVNVVVKPDRYERYREAVRLASVLAVEGTVEREHDVVNVVLRSCRAVEIGEATAPRSRDFQ